MVSSCATAVSECIEEWVYMFRGRALCNSTSGMTSKSRQWSAGETPPMRARGRQVILWVPWAACVMRDVCEDPGEQSFSHETFPGLPNGARPPPDADDAQRETFIRAKYERRCCCSPTECALLGRSSAHVVCVRPRPQTLTRRHHRAGGGQLPRKRRRGSSPLRHRRPLLGGGRLRASRARTRPAAALGRAGGRAGTRRRAT